MKRHYFTREVKVIETWEIEADSQEQALEKLNDTYGTVIDQDMIDNGRFMFSYTEGEE